jgi:hypothetical protein
MKRSPLANIQIVNIPTTSNQDLPAPPKLLDATASHLAPFVNNRPSRHISEQELQRPTPMLTPAISTEEPVSNDTPINSLDYFESPIETLVHSVAPNSDLSFHDLADAYATLSTRIRSQSQEIVKDQPFPALRPLKEHSNAILQCLRRDMKQALIDSFLDKTTSCESILSDLGSFSEETIEYARNQSVLSHSALRFVCDLFRFAALYSIFSSRSTDSLLKLPNTK